MDSKESREQFEKLYALTKKRIYDRIAAKCYAIDDVDDIFQNTYLAVIRALEKLDEPPPEPEAFVMLICSRQLMKYYSAARRLRERIAVRIDSTDVQSPELSDTFSIEDSIIDRSVLTEIHTLLRRKPLTTQKVFFLYYKRGLTITETAELLGISESSVKMHLYRTLDEIKRRYRSKEGAE